MYNQSTSKKYILDTDIEAKADKAIDILQDKIAIEI